jgi:hypothetical protein
MKRAGREAIVMHLAEVVENESFTEVAEADGLTIRIMHRAERLNGTCVKIVYRTQITGDRADELGPHVGSGVTAAFPDSIAKLAQHRYAGPVS